MENKTTPLADVEGSQELKPCPFCGAPAQVFDGFADGLSITVECTKCRSRGLIRASGTPVENRTAVIKAWNTRSLDASKEVWDRAKRLAKSRIGVCTNNIPHLTAKDVQILWDDLDDLFESEFPGALISKHQEGTK